MARAIVGGRASAGPRTATAIAPHDPNLFMRGLAFGVGLSLPIWLVAGYLTFVMP